MGLGQLVRCIGSLFDLRPLVVGVVVGRVCSREIFGVRLEVHELLPVLVRRRRHKVMSGIINHEGLLGVAHFLI